jgi:hypothetical protein
MNSVGQEKIFVENPDEIGEEIKARRASQAKASNFYSDVIFQHFEKSFLLLIILIWHIKYFCINYNTFYCEVSTGKITECANYLQHIFNRNFHDTSFFSKPTIRRSRW